MQPAVARDAQSRNPPPSATLRCRARDEALDAHNPARVVPARVRRSLLLHSGIKITRELAQLLPLRPGNALGLGMGMRTGTVAGYAGRQIAGSSANETGNHTHSHTEATRFAWNVGAQTRSPCGVTNNVRMRTLLNRRLAEAFVVYVVYPGIVRKVG